MKDRLTKKLARFFPFLMLFVIAIPAILPLVRPGFFVSDDGDWMIIRLSAFHEALRTGQFPVRFLERLNHGYGYPVLNFNYPLPFYIGEGIHLLGFGFIDSVKIVLALSMLGGFLAVGFWIGRKWGIRAGLMAAVLYTYSPYHLFDLYTRGSLGEIVALFFLPLAFYYVDLLREQSSLVRIGIMGLILAALVTAHNVIAFISLPFLITYAFWQLLPFPINRKLVVNYIFSFVIGLAISAFFWIPAIGELQYTRSSQVLVASYSDYFLGGNNFLPILGLVIPLVGLLSLIAVLRWKNKTAIYFLIMTIGTIFLATPLAKPLWVSTPLPQLVQFPWRFSSLTILASAVLAGFLVKDIRRTYLLAIFIILVLVLGWSQVKVIKSSHSEEFFRTNDATSTVKTEYMPKWVTVDPTNLPPTHLALVSAQGNIVSADFVNITASGVVRINEVYFPGQEVRVDGKVVEVDYERDGFLHIWVETGEHRIQIRFKETPLRKIADIISLIGLGVVGLIFLKNIFGKTHFLPGKL